MKSHNHSLYKANLARITWTSRVKKGRPIIKYGTDTGINYTLNKETVSISFVGMLWLKVNTITSSTYTKEEMCGGLATGKGWKDYGPGTFYSGVLSII